jgi:hypothetical protein
MIAVQLSLSQTLMGTTAGIYLLDVEGTPIALSLREFTNMSRFCTANGATLVNPVGGPMTLIFNGSEKALEPFLMYILDGTYH